MGYVLGVRSRVSVCDGGDCSGVGLLLGCQLFLEWRLPFGCPK